MELDGQQAHNLGRKPSRNLPVDARGVQFSDTSEVEQSLHWWRVDAQDLFPCWMEGTDVSDTESEEEQTETHDQSISLPWDVHPQTLDHNSPLTSDRLADRLEWLLQRTTLEPTTTAPIHKSPDPPLPHPLRVLHTRRSVPYQKPIAPIGEPITCQFPLSNPMHIPLVLHNLHLLWSFQLDSSRTTTGLLQQQPQHLRVISNETNSVVATSRSIRQLVSTDVLSELILLPEENKTFEVGLVVRQKGELLIHGLCFDWDYQSTQFVQSATFDTNDPVEGIAVEHLVKSAFSAPETSASVQESLRLAKNGFITGKWMGSSFPNYESASAVRGKVTLLNFSLNVDAGEPKLPETLSPLAWTITNAAPLLKVAFSDLPSKILQGQVFRLELTLSNLGSEPLSRIRLASNWPGSITFGSDGFSRNPDHSVIYETRDSHTQCHSIWRSVLAVQPWIEVPYYQSHEPVPVLLPGSTVSIPMWLRAPHLSHSYRSLPKSRMARRRASTPISIYGPSSATQQRLIHLAFQYAVTKQNQDYPVLNYRFVRHHHELELRPSLRLEALAVPSHCTGVHTLLILLRIHNQTPKSTKTSFEILQVSCGSRNWAISPPPSSLPVHMVDRPRVDPGGTIVLYLQAVPSLSYPDDQDSTTSTPITRSVTRTLFTTVPYSSGELVEVTASPCIDFYQLSGVNWNHSIRKRPNKESLGITLVLLWKARVASVDPSEGAFYGQSHVSITRLGIPAVVPFEEHHPPDQPRISPCPSEPVVTPRSSQLVRLHLRHASRLVHTFCTRPLLSNRPSASTCSPLAPNPAPCTAPLQTAMLDSIQWVTKCLAVIPVEVVLFNATCVPVELVLESSDVTSQANEQNSLASIPLNQHELLNPLVCRRLGANAVMSCVRWVGLIRQRFMLSANESRVLHLEARVPRPGMYRLDNLLLRAREKVPSGGEFVSQAIPTSWVLVDADASTAVNAQSNPMNGYASPLLHSTCTSPCVPYC
ncbi:unnamed protein product [Dicrocoelium dendriticum]|nr:unnamed protein product [Dicrocoelium dendriticum]